MLKRWSWDFFFGYVVGLATAILLLIVLSGN